MSGPGEAVEHYEMSRYGTLRTWAEELGMSDAVALLDATVKEEKDTHLELIVIVIRARDHARA
jgi:ferritin-like metal-binding protein YciE